MELSLARFVWLLLFASCSAVAAAVPPDVVASLAPAGTLHAAINYGNPVLAQRIPADGAPHGVSADLARELGRELGVAVSFVIYNEAGAVAQALKADPHAWDVGFLAIDPVRAADIAFTDPYVVIEGTYLVPSASPLGAIDDVDRPGVRVSVATGSAYDLYLTRALAHAQLARFPDTAAAISAFEQQHLDALAGVRQPLAIYAAAHSDVRMIPGRFMTIEQAMALPKGRQAGLDFVNDFVERQKASGFVARALAASGQSSAAVAPPAAR